MLVSYSVLTQYAGMYLKSGKLPVRVPLYIAIVALARYMILDMKNLDTLRMPGLAGAIFINAIAIFVIRYGHTKFHYENSKNI